jgi:hypothetical protein
MCIQSFVRVFSCCPRLLPPQSSCTRDYVSLHVLLWFEFHGKTSWPCQSTKSKYFCKTVLSSSEIPAVRGRQTLTSWFMSFPMTIRFSFWSVQDIHLNSNQGILSSPPLFSRLTFGFQKPGICSHHFTIGFQKPGTCTDSWFLEFNGKMVRLGLSLITKHTGSGLLQSSVTWPLR